MSLLLLSFFMLLMVLNCLGAMMFHRIYMLNYLLAFEMLNVLIITWLGTNLLSILSVSHLFFIIILMLCDSILGLVLLILNFRNQSNSMLESKTFMLW